MEQFAFIKDQKAIVKKKNTREIFALRFFTSDFKVQMHLRNGRRKSGHSLTEKGNTELKPSGDMQQLGNDSPLFM